MAQTNTPWARVFRRELLTALRKIRDEGVLYEDQTICSNVYRINKWIGNSVEFRRQERRLTSYLYKVAYQRTGLYKDKFTEGGYWRTRKVLETLHWMIRFLENSPMYLGTDMKDETNVSK